MKRTLYFALGVAALALGVLGAFLPLLPTAPDIDISNAFARTQAQLTTRGRVRDNARGENAGGIRPAGCLVVSQARGFVAANGRRGQRNPPARPYQTGMTAGGERLANKPAVLVGKS